MSAINYDLTIEKNSYTMKVKNAKPCLYCGCTSVSVFHRQQKYLDEGECGSVKVLMQAYCRCNKCYARGMPISYIGFFCRSEYDDEHEYGFSYKYKLKAIEEWNKR